MTIKAIPAAAASSSSSCKTEPIALSAAGVAKSASASLSIDIPVRARSALEGTDADMPPLTPPYLSSSASSTSSFESAFEAEMPLSPAVAGADVKMRHLSQQFFFPNQFKFESMVPEVVKATDIYLKDHPMIDGAFAEYENLYNADSLMTRDGRPMVRLAHTPIIPVVDAETKARRQSQQYFFPNQAKFECAVPKTVRARDIRLKDHPMVHGAYAEYERLYNADSLMTRDGRAMVRLL
ncbi:hypothetical protein EC968_010435 [Mortierella alpina]|nr:hypothetical protein EC968_010435 [Mortierella alpina]